MAQMHSQEIEERQLCLFIRLRDLYQNLYGSSIAFLIQSVDRSLFTRLILVLRDSIRCAIPDVVADDGYWQNRLGIQ